MTIPHTSLHVDSPLACPRCGVVDQPALGPGNGPHAFRALCRHCGVHRRWLSRYTPQEQAARREQARLAAMAQRPPSQRQLASLQALGDVGPVPATMAEARARIDAALQRLEGDV